MTNVVWEIYVACGVRYFAVLILSFIAVLGLIIKLLLSSKAPAYWLLLPVSVIPLGIGLCATFDGYFFLLHTDRNVQMSSEEMEAGYAVARVTSYFGAILSAPLVLLAMVGVAIKRRRKPVQNTSEIPPNAR